MFNKTTNKYDDDVVCLKKTAIDNITYEKIQTFEKKQRWKII